MDEIMRAMVISFSNSGSVEKTQNVKISMIHYRIIATGYGKEPVLSFPTSSKWLNSFPKHSQFVFLNFLHKTSVCHEPTRTRVCYEPPPPHREKVPRGYIRCDFFIRCMIYGVDQKKVNLVLDQLERCGFLHGVQHVSKNTSIVILDIAKLWPFGWLFWNM